jgi:predicted RNA binding protein YcfA (HicA-like mRNA interferase family)
VSRLNNVSGRQAMRVAERMGWSVRRGKGDHVLYEKSGFRGVPIPDHRELNPGTLRSIIRGLGLSVDEFLDALKK